MSKILYTAVLLAAVVFVVSAVGCQAPGGGSGSDGHYGHSH